jgi:hypothetical protein
MNLQTCKSCNNSSLLLTVGCCLLGTWALELSVANSGGVVVTYFKFLVYHGELVIGEVVNYFKFHL